MKALLILCLQQDFCSFGNMETPGADELISISNELMPRFDKVIAVNFAFPPDHISFAANHLFRQPGKTMKINGRDQLLKAMHCVDGSFGAEFPKELNRKTIDLILKVGQSAEHDVNTVFSDLNSAENELEKYLKAASISGLYFMGIASDFMINSIQESESKGFKTVLISNAIAGEAEALSKCIDIESEKVDWKNI